MLLNFLLDHVANRLADFTLKGPADHPDDYLRRWWVIPRNPVFNIYLHNIRGPDDDRALHDHPWVNLSILLNGGYQEWLVDGYRVRHPGEWVWRWPWTAHRLVPLPAEQYGQCWTLFITGPRVRDWGFLCPQGWRSHNVFNDPNDNSKVGKGCD